MPEYLVVCRDCEWEQPMPKRELAEHAKRVHEEWYDHTVVLDAYSQGPPSVTNRLGKKSAPPRFEQMPDGRAHCVRALRLACSNRLRMDF